MSKYVFLNVPTYGHVNPTLPVVQELVRRGEQVIYYLTEEFRTAVEATGATFRPYQSMMGQIQPPTRMKGQGPGAMPLMMLKESRQALPQILDALHAEPPDVLVYGAMCLWGRLAGQILQIPMVALRPTYAMNEHFGLLNDEVFAIGITPEMIEQMQNGIMDLCSTYHIPPFDMRQFLSYAEALNIVFLPRAFQPAGETFDERFVFVGPALQLRPDTMPFSFEHVGEQPLLYISLGTVFNNRPDFFQLCFQAFGGQPWQVVMSYGKRLDVAALGAVPANFLLAPYVPQLEILQKASVFITHGGMNSTMESLYYGVPMVVVPQMLEQEMTARRVAELGLGRTLDEEHLTAEQLREVVVRVQHDVAILQCVQKMQQTVRTAGGYQLAADVILSFASKRMLTGQA